MQLSALSGHRSRGGRSPLMTSAAWAPFFAAAHNTASAGMWYGLIARQDFAEGQTSEIGVD